jgi:hypothetical protein
VANPAARYIDQRNKIRLIFFFGGFQCFLRQRRSRLTA